MADKNDKMEFKIEWCQLCSTNMVICPKCGNNSCNAGYGEIKGKTCDVCPLAYQFQSLYWKLNKFCACPKECICEWEKCDDILDVGFPYRLIESNPKCPAHNKINPIPDCPVHDKE